MEQGMAFQKIWMESITKGMQAAFTVSPTSPPSEIMLHIRGGIFKALAQSWEEFMRSPQFLEGIQQTMEQVVTFRKMSKDFLGKARNEMQAPSRDDVDAIMRGMHHMESRLLDRVEELAGQFKSVSERVDKVAAMAAQPAQAAAAAAKRTPQARKTKSKQ